MHSFVTWSSDYQCLIVTNVRHGSNYAYAQKKKKMCIEITAFSGKKRNIESVIIKSLQKNLTYFVNGMHFFLAWIQY